MGKVREEQISHNRGIHEYEALSFSDIDVVKSLIRFRSEIDPFFTAKLFDDTYDYYKSNSSPIFYELIDCIYLDLERLIKNARLTEKQLYIVKAIMMGYLEIDIAETNNDNEMNIRRIFETACQKIVDRNNFEWREYLETSGLIKIPSEVKYKQCSKCGEWKRVNHINFSPNQKGLYGVHSVCRQCRC
jgi:hypothetical protein